MIYIKKFITITAFISLLLCLSSCGVIVKTGEVATKTVVGVGTTIVSAAASII